MRYRLIVSQETVTKTSQELRSKYESAKQKKLSHQVLVDAQVEDFQKVQLEVLKNTNLVRKGLKRLAAIALRPDPLSHVDYIDQLIRSEQQGAKPGWKERVSQLEEIRKQAEQMSKIADEEYDPFADYKKTPSAFEVTPEEEGVLQKMASGLKKNMKQFLGIK